MPRKLIKYVPGEIALLNLAKDWLSKAMTPSGISSGATDTIKNGIRTIQGVITSTSTSTYGGKYFHTNIVNGWLNPNQASKKFIITCDFMDMTEKETGSVAFYSNGTMNAVNGVLRNTTQKNVWQRVACIGNIPNSIDSRRHGLSTGESFKYAFKDFAVYDVTDIDSSLYPAIARQDWYAIKTGLEAIQMRAGRGIIRSGRRISIDTASEDEVASGAFDKAITPDKLKAWVENGDSYKVYDNSGNAIKLLNLCANFLDITNFGKYSIDNYQNIVWSNMRSISGQRGSVSTTGGCEINFNSARFIDQNGNAVTAVSGHKYIVTVDVMNDAIVESSYVDIGIGSVISGVLKQTNLKHAWQRLASIYTATSSTISVYLRLLSIPAGTNLRMSFKNFAIYDVTDISSSYYPLIASGKTPLLQGESPVQINGRAISYQKASVADVIGNTANKNYIVDAGTFHKALSLPIMNVTYSPQGIGGYNQVSFDGGTTWEAVSNTTLQTGNDARYFGEFSIRNQSASSAECWIGFSVSSYGILHPVANIAGHRYLAMADVRCSGAALKNTCMSVYNPNRTNMSFPSAANRTTYTRVYGIFTGNTARFFIDSYANATGTSIKLDIKNLRQFDVTDWSDSDIQYLATLPEAQLNDPDFLYLVGQDSVCPFIPIVDVSSMSTVSVQAGLVYRIIATSGTHVLTVSNLPTDAVGDEAYIQIKTGSSSTITVQQPLMLMDAIKPNAINNCVVKFINGEARLYVEDISNGYVVVIASGTEYGSLHYGLSNLSNIDVNYISFGSTVDNIAVHSSEPIAFMHQPISIVGNGRDITTIDFDHGVIGTDKSFYVGYATIKDVTVNGGNVQLENGGLEGVVKLEGSSLSLSGRTKFDANVIGANITIAPGSTVSGTGSIDLQQTQSKRIELTAGVLEGVTIYNGKMAGYGGGFWTANTTTPVDTINVTVIGCSSSSSGGGFSYRSKYGNIINVTVKGCTSGSWGGGFETSHCKNTNYHTIVRNVYVEGCKAGQGGGIAIYNNYTDIYGGTIKNCTCTSIGSAIAVASSATASVSGLLVDGCSGKDVIDVPSGTKLTLTGCTVSNCTMADLNGGVIYLNGGVLQVTNTTFDHNSSGATTMGSVYFGSGGTFTNCTFTNNSSTTSNSAAVYINSSYTVTLDKCTFSNNTPYNLSVIGNAVATLNNVTMSTGNIYASATAKMTISGYFIFKGTIAGNYPIITLVSGATINLQGNNNTNAIRGSTITAQGTFVVIDKNGTTHDFTAATKTNSIITNLGVWS